VIGALFHDERVFLAGSRCETEVKETNVQSRLRKLIQVNIHLDIPTDKNCTAFYPRIQPYMQLLSTSDGQIYILVEMGNLIV